MIDLESTVFSMKEIVHELPATWAFSSKKFVSCADFGTIFIGNVLDEDKEMSLPQPGAPVFSAPKDWRMPHLLKALGAFPSTSQASKNGWNMDIPEGCSSFIVRIAKVKGEIWIHKNSENEER